MKDAERALSKIKEMVKPHVGIWDEPWRILITTIMSTRTKDEVTDRASLKLFCKFPNMNNLSRANQSEIEELIKPVGFYKQKAKNVKLTSKMLINNFNSEVPRDIESLLVLPGVGRKVANIVLSYGFGDDAIAVDTHVMRISNRIGLVRSRKPEHIEHSLETKVPQERWNEINTYFVEFGKNICKPINPRCNLCLIKEECNYFRRRK